MSSRWFVNPNGDLTTGIFAARDIKFLVQKQGDEESSEEDEMDEKAGPVTPHAMQ